jgi:hypothetical protein
MSFIAETFIFLYVGMDALDKEKWKMTDVRFVLELLNLLEIMMVVHILA